MMSKMRDREAVMKVMSRRVLTRHTSGLLLSIAYDLEQLGADMVYEGLARSGQEVQEAAATLSKVGRALYDGKTVTNPVTKSSRRDNGDA